jgi:methylated-DNA-[protein]-cysteine S-methyltransferase
LTFSSRIRNIGAEHKEVLSLNILKTAYVLISSDFGPLVLVWSSGLRPPRVLRIFLPGEKKRAERVLRDEFPKAVRKSHRDIEALCIQIQAFLQGEPVAFSLDRLDFGICNDFQRRVLKGEAKIPRGRVCTYSRLAEKIGAHGAARAVGNALARNPFPVIIPCHRTIRADGHLGSFQGGVPLKRALLEMEGVVFDEKGRVPDRFLW